MNRWLRLGALLLTLVALFVLAQVTGLREAVTASRLQETVRAAGLWGLALFFAAFVVGQLMQVPGVVFLLAARLSWGPVLGFVTGYVGALLSASLVFLIVRTLGGRALAELTWPPARRVLAGLERRPVFTVAWLRTVLLLNPPLNYALALSPVRPRDHFVGSVVGLVFPVALTIALAEGALALVR